MLDKWNCHSSIHGFVAGPNIHLTMEESTHDTSCVTTSRLAADAAPSRTHQFKTDEPNKQKYISVSRRTKPTPKLTILCLYQVVCKIDLLSCFQSLNFEMLNNNTAHNNTFARTDSGLEAFSRYPTNIGMQKELFSTLLAHSFDPTVPLVLSWIAAKVCWITG